jgi:hypothetical protein
MEEGRDRLARLGGNVRVVELGPTSNSKSRLSSLFKPERKSFIPLRKQIDSRSSKQQSRVRDRLRQSPFVPRLGRWHRP